MAYSKQTFTFNQVATSTQLNQIETNIADHYHGKDGVGKIGISFTREALTGAHTAVAADVGKLFDITSGTFTINFDPAATLGAGWSASFDNNGSGIVTLSPDGSEEIDGESSKAITPGSAVIVYSDGSNLHTLPVGGGRILLTSQDLAGVATSSIDFTNMSSAFDEYIYELVGLQFVTDNNRPHIRLAFDGGGFETSSNYYYWYIHSNGGAVASAENTSTTIVTGAATAGNDTQDGVSGTVQVYNANRNSAPNAQVRWALTSYGVSTSENFGSIGGAGFVNNTGVLTGIRFFPGVGTNFSDGIIRQYGVRK